MKISLKWLKQYIDCDLPHNQIAEILTMAGSEVGKIQVVGEGWGDYVLVGELTGINPHPNADRLRLATVNYGSGQETVVCGAPNLTVGDKIAFARVGAELIDGHSSETKRMRLKAAKIRGVASSGMVCSEKELGLSDEHQGILVLPPESKVGEKLVDLLGDVIFDLEITPNRPDCLSVLGIVRELAALTGAQVKLPEDNYEETADDITQTVSVNIADPDLCFRYSASLITDIQLGDSPHWMQQCLKAAGMRPINNIVDITNFVMMEYGQPLHAFDYDMVSEGGIIVRRAKSGESIVSLDGVTRKLLPDMLMITDKDRTIGIAGVMGGFNSEVTEKTKSILLESANFKASSIHYTGRQLNLPSEACMRFERGISREITVAALKRATYLMVKLAGGKVAKGIIDEYPGKSVSKPIALSVEKVNRVLGTSYTLGEIKDTCLAVGCQCTETSNTAVLDITSPYWRSDLTIAEDFIEEVARIRGYDSIPLRLFNQELPPINASGIFDFKRKVRDIITAFGFQELISYSLVGRELMVKQGQSSDDMTVQPLRVMNPMTEEQEYLRVSLRGNLLAALASNRRYEDGGIKLAELGREYQPQADDLPKEPEILCGVMAGLRNGQQWQGTVNSVDFYDVKGVIEGLCHRLKLPVIFSESQDTGLTPGNQATINVDGEFVGVIGEVHPRILQAFEINEPVYLLEIDIKKIFNFTGEIKRYQQLPRFPSVVRDLALILDFNISHQQVNDIITSSPLVKEVRLFDVYSGEQVTEGKKSLAYHLVFQSNEHTLTDAEVDNIQQKILSKLAQELGVSLRG